MFHSSTTSDWNGFEPNPNVRPWLAAGAEPSPGAPPSLGSVQSRMSRVARGWIAGSFATGIAALSHGLADGGSPSPVALVVALVFAGLLGTFAIGRRPSLPRLTIVVAGSQLAFHLLFSWLTPGTATGDGHHALPTLLEPAAAHHGTDPLMWAAHAVAMLATLVFLRKAELALFTLIRDAVLDTVDAVTRVPVIAARPRVDRAARASEPRHPVLVFLKFVVSHRGPPSAPAL